MAMPQLAPNISGSVPHLVLENALRRQGAAFRDLTPEQLDYMADAILESVDEMQRGV